MTSVRGPRPFKGGQTQAISGHSITAPGKSGHGGIQSPHEPGRTHPQPSGRTRVIGMPHEMQGKQNARTWREIRAEAVKEGRLDEAALAAHKRRMLAEERNFAKHQQDDEDADA